MAGIASATQLARAVADEGGVARLYAKAHKSKPVDRGLRLAQPHVAGADEAVLSDVRAVCSQPGALLRRPAGTVSNDVEPDTAHLERPQCIGHPAAHG